MNLRIADTFTDSLAEPSVAPADSERPFEELLSARQTHTRAWLHLGSPLATAGRHRREVAAEARHFIRTALE